MAVHLKFEIINGKFGNVPAMSLWMPQSYQVPQEIMFSNPNPIPA